MSNILESQKAYYDARAQEYESSLGFQDGTFGSVNPDGGSLCALQRFVRVLPVVETTVELGCGTGIWTRELLKSSRLLHAVDASERMLELNESVNGGAVTFERVDMYDWEPARRFDRVAAAFVLSHVPDPLLQEFIAKIARLTVEGGSALIIDEGVPERQTDSHIEVRELSNGTTFRIIKVYRAAEHVRNAFSTAFGAVRAEIIAGRFFAMLFSK